LQADFVVWLVARAALEMSGYGLAPPLPPASENQALAWGQSRQSSIAAVPVGRIVRIAAISPFREWACIGAQSRPRDPLSG